MDKVIKVILMMNDKILISEIDEVGADVGEPDCKLINPMEVCEGNMLAPWMMEHTKQDIFMISSDKILTLAEPTMQILDIYKGLV